ncbi:MAG: Holliday junction branch migration protein RuvA [Clostridiales bacterium]|nr:Holliday junction branch migration protein RuvA [Clostridiales bacterium]
MIGYIKGEVVAIIGNTLILENNSMGFELTVSNSTIASINQAGTFVKIHTYLHVRDDAMLLYGFFTKEEKDMFLKLITISGVGPKAAISILSGIEIGQLALCILSGDVKTLTKVKGIGKKTAERIILELKESIDSQSATLISSGEIMQSEENDKDIIDAVSALRALGISNQDALKAVKQAKTQTDKIEEIIAIALRNLC